MHADSNRAIGRAALAIGALGVVFGDIGTSPIYTVQTAFDPGDPHPIAASVESVFGFVSLVFWAVLLVVTVKYVGLVMKADNQGEGGIMALISQIRQIGNEVSGGAKFVLAGVGVFGAALFFGDSMITPAISVMSAVEGTKTISSSMGSYVIPITVTIIVVMFMIQRRGAGSIGHVFGPVMLAWFTTIGTLGIRGISIHPEVLKALSPGYTSSSTAGRRASSPSPPWSWRSPDARRSTPTWVTSGAPRSPAPGCSWSFRRAFCATWGRGR